MRSCFHVTRITPNTNEAVSPNQTQGYGPEACVSRHAHTYPSGTKPQS